jgi:hypothetical protein
MTGPLVLPGDPVAALEAAPKQYVDGLVANYLPLVGGTMQGDIDMGGWSITNMLDPTQPQDAVTKAYVDGLIVPASTVDPLMDGTAAPGTAVPYSREDHVHPSDTSRVALAGDTMTGALVLAADPVNPLEAATKQYVDAADALMVLKSGDTMTGTLVLSNDPVNPMDAATKQYVDTSLADYLPLAGGGMLGPIDFTGYAGAAGIDMANTLISNVADPVAPQDAVNKQYVDGLVVPSVADPLMDGIAAPGVAVPYSREDHVHPSDTSLLPLDGSHGRQRRTSCGGDEFARGPRPSLGHLALTARRLPRHDGRAGFRHAPDQQRGRSDCAAGCSDEDLRRHSRCDRQPVAGHLRCRQQHARSLRIGCAGRLVVDGDHGRPQRARGTYHRTAAARYWHHGRQR